MKASSSTALGTVNYGYNALEQRVSKSGPSPLVPTGVAYFVYDEAGNLLGEYDASGTPIYETVYLGASAAALPVGVIKPGGLYYVYADHIHTPRVITRPSDNAVVWRWDTAEAFGATAADQNPSNLGAFAYNQRFPGQVFDAETGLFQNWHREYDARQGRYRQSDPIGLAGGVNTFAYVGGNPLSRIDPKGLATPSDISIAIDVIKQFVPELYPVSPTSVTMVPGLSNWMGMPLQGYTDLQNNVQIHVTLYGDSKTPVDEFLLTGFLQTLAHEMLHVQQSTFEKGLTHGPLHDQIDSNAEFIAERVLKEFQRKRKLTHQDAYGCPPK